DAVVRVVLEHCGTVDKFVGDAVFAFWNAPTLQSDFEIATCRAALAVKAATNALNETWRQEGKPAWYTRIGVHTGDAVVGNVGSSDRLDYTAIGDTVNMGSRIEGLNKFYGTQILVSDAMAARVQEVFLLRPVDTVVPKGGSAPFKIWELVGERDQISGEDSARCEAWHGV
ncbi:MAG: adenylate/guanylate cyclase domain-containing protein, partial [Planctomycetes bacterium]|nr:adenylate/guanylate cyclase domain-containing protein [Planctomycetota bacterium]